MVNGHNQIDNLILLNELQQFTMPSTTATGFKVPTLEGDFQKNQINQLANIAGSIRPTPFHETKEGQDLLLDLVMGNPGSAIGRVSKAAITGGQKASGMSMGNKELRKGLQDWLKRNVPKGKVSEGLQKSNIAPKAPGKRYKDFAEFEWDNKLNAARIKAEKVYDKYNIPHEPEMVDPITTLLNLLKKGHIKRN